ncbi:hypothetical protein EMIHUDRAFT_448706 [Emiliania huxleyi CCMP1516]|uniref:STAS domain-containing protein n=2 Tax=Emiliania huxleyi TaxID=2903 RepID=A0A0D3KZH8_EMIH1|nr:hypothetical protein EMIHUDRAFT_448706 [Emiliania huxleyi CCMP1516]EOD41163.1 hypothetical protein EMIHUDRAFT_448706 [Emiliania huxleyi CCMP1516]|eukprot:XP_005793592.1 hypothetical protein EMIHUDRAFT_448706 [Emiliania huxleyi CCMP1516]
MNAELRAAGSASALAALVGGVAAHPSPDYVTALRQAGVRTRAVGVATIALTASVLASGLPLMNVLPRPLLGSLLMANGVELTKLWLWDARRWIDRPGFAMLFAMICSALLFGQTAAVLLGALCAVFLSHLRLSRANALKYHLTSRSCHPPASRPHHAQAFLRRHGGAIHLIGLEGFLYGGTVSRLSRYVLRASERHGREMRFVLLDLQATHGIEPSACTLLRRLRRQLKARGVSLLVAAASSQMQGCESRASCGGAPATAALDSAVYRTVDEALESCEEQLLLLGSPVKSSHREGPSAFSTGGGGRHSGAASVGKGAAEGKGAYGAKVTLQPGELLTSQGNLNREVLVVPPSGAELSVTTDYGSPDGPLTLATMRHGGVFGAEGVLLGLPSVSSAVLSRSSPPRVVISLSAAQLRGLRLSQPQLAQQLLAAAFTQQQDYLWLLARRTSLWTGGGHGGPNLDWGSAQPQLVPSADGAPLPTIPSEVSLPESFGRKEVRSAVLSPWRHAVSPQERTPYSAGSRGAGHIAGLMDELAKAAARRDSGGVGRRSEQDAALTPLLEKLPARFQQRLLSLVGEKEGAERRVQELERSVHHAEATLKAALDSRSVVQANLRASERRIQEAEAAADRHLAAVESEKQRYAILARLADDQAAESKAKISAQGEQLHVLNEQLGAANRAVGTLRAHQSRR